MKTVTHTGSWRTLWLQKSPRGTNEVLRRLANGCWRNAVKHSSVSETEPTRCSCRCCWDTMYNRAFQSSQRVKTLIEFLKTRRYALLLPGRVRHVENEAGDVHFVSSSVDIIHVLKGENICGVQFSTQRSTLKMVFSCFINVQNSNSHIKLQHQRASSSTFYKKCITELNGVVF